MDINDFDRGRREDESPHDPEINYPNEFIEETSVELTDNKMDDHEVTDNNDLMASGSIVAWIGIALSILSFLMLPLLFASAGIILGVIARMQDTRTLGYTAMAIGIVSLIVRLFFVLF